jgi:polysaccharide biosynthesis protein PslA
MLLEAYGQFVSRIGGGQPSAPSKLVLRARAYAMLLAGDLLAVMVGLALASWVRLGDPLHSQTLAIMGVIVPLFALFGARNLSIEALEDWCRGLLASYLALIAAFAVILFVAFCLKTSTEMSRLVMIGGTALSALLLCGWRMLAAPINRAVLGGEAMSTLMITDRIDEPVPPIAGSIDASLCGLDGPLLEPYSLDRLAKLLEGHDGVVVACLPDRREEWISVLRAMGLRAHILIPELRDVDSVSATNPWGWVQATVAEGPMQLRDRIIKRAFDIVLAIVSLVLLAPLLLLVAAAIKLDSEGPVFFRQARVGQANRMFSMFKFRSMYTKDSDTNGHVSTSRKDPRVTRVGQFIRRTSLDELPQIINILRGEMSFVGPRPHALGSRAGEELFWNLDERYWRRHLLPPGITGLAQVRGFRGATPSPEDLLDRLSADLEYIRGWSVLRDFAIIFRTLRVLLHKNAY